MNSTRNDLGIHSFRIISESPANLPTIESAVGLVRNLISPIEIVIQNGFFSHDSPASEELLHSFVKQRLVDPSDRDATAFDTLPLRGFESRVLRGESRARGVPYNGEGLGKLYRTMMTEERQPPTEITAVVTDRLIMSWSDDDLRYHARVAVFGFPSVISISGLLEAPARPREYYLSKQALGSMGITSSAEKHLQENFSGRFLEQDDDRMPEVLRGISLQALFYNDSLEPFCENRDCVLFNAHWQEDMIHAQIESGKLCEKHSSRLEKLRGGEPVRWAASR